MIRVLSATAVETAVERYTRMSACASCACAGVATLPVPMAQTGSYATTILLFTRNQERVSSAPPFNEHGRRAPPVGLLEDLNDRLELLLDDGLGLARLALLERLADAEDNREARGDRGARLVRDELRGFVEERAALRVPCESRAARA